jgi:hypothetical protein
MAIERILRLGLLFNLVAVSGYQQELCKHLKHIYNFMLTMMTYPSNETFFYISKKHTVNTYSRFV